MLRGLTSYRRKEKARQGLQNWIDGCFGRGHKHEARKRGFHQSHIGGAVAEIFDVESHDRLLEASKTERNWHESLG